LDKNCQKLYLAEISKKVAFFQQIQTLQDYLVQNQMSLLIICQQEADYFQEIFHKEAAFLKIRPKIHQLHYLETKIKIFSKKMNKNKKMMMKMKAIRMMMNTQQFCWIMSRRLMILLKN
jgi:hypothetical protein